MRVGRQEHSLTVCLDDDWAEDSSAVLYETKQSLATTQESHLDTFAGNYVHTKNCTQMLIQRFIYFNKKGK